MSVDAESRAGILTPHAAGNGYRVDAVGKQRAGVRVPLRYNNDKRKKPLFSRGLSVCRHLFNSFSKLKYDEKIIE